MVNDLEWLVSYEAGGEETVPDQGIVIDNEHWRMASRRHDLDKEIAVYVHRVDVRQPLTVEPQGDPSDPRVCCNLMVTGRMDLLFADGPTATLSPQQGLFYCPAQMRAGFVLAPGARIAMVGSAFAPAALRRLLADDCPPALERLLTASWSDSVMLPYRTTRWMREVGRAMVDPGLTGRLLTLFLEGALLQLLSLQVAVLRAEETTVRPLTPTEAARVREAREQLVADMSAPPRVTDLAAAVGLTEKRLSEGFRLFYGTSVFDYLRRERLDHARRAIEATDIPIKQIAHRVGYRHVTNFISAFTQQFGESPSRFRQRAVPALD